MKNLEDHTGKRINSCNEWEENSGYWFEQWNRKTNIDGIGAHGRKGVNSWS